VDSGPEEGKKKNRPDSSPPPTFREKALSLRELADQRRREREGEKKGRRWRKNHGIEGGEKKGAQERGRDKDDRRKDGKERKEKGEAESGGPKAPRRGSGAQPARTDKK
jgi:hypothetical protein